MKIINIGCYPPPFGGVSVHLKRLKEHLEKKGIENIVIDLSGWNTNEKMSNGINVMTWKKSIIYLLFHKKTILHFHNFSWKNTFIYYILGFKHFTILSFHNERFLSEIERVPGVIQKLIVKFINAINCIICVKKDDRKMLIEKGYINICYIIPAFIPPVEEETGIEQLPEYFHKIQKKHSFLITANASRISFYKNEDLYGIDMSIELIRRLVRDGYTDIGFIYIIPNIKEYHYLEKMEKLIKLYELENNFYFYTKPVPYPAVINMCELFIRPTNTDGDALSLREAITLRKPAVASDVVKRPEGTILFKNRDIEDLNIKTKYCIEHYSECKKQLDNIEFENNADKIIKVYMNK